MLELINTSLHWIISVGSFVILLISLLCNITHIQALYKKASVRTAAVTYFQHNSLSYGIMGAILLYLLLGGGPYAALFAIMFCGVIIVGSQILSGNSLSDNEKKED